MLDIDPEKRTGLLEQAALGGEETINGLALRPMTYGTHSLYMRLKMACGIDGEVDHNFALAAFVWIHSQTVEALAARYAKPAELIADIFAYMADKPFSYFRQFEEWSGRQMNQYLASITQASGASSEDPKV